MTAATRRDGSDREAGGAELSALVGGLTVTFRPLAAGSADT